MCTHTNACTSVCVQEDNLVSTLCFETGSLSGLKLANSASLKLANQSWIKLVLPPRVEISRVCHDVYPLKWVLGVKLRSSQLQSEHFMGNLQSKSLGAWGRAFFGGEADLLLADCTLGLAMAPEAWGDCRCGFGGISLPMASPLRSHLFELPQLPCR